MSNVKSDLEKVFTAKRESRKKLAARPIAEKLRMVEELAERTLATRKDTAAKLPDDPWEIPSNWSWKRMGEVSRVVGGGTPRTDRPEYFGGEVPWITPADLSKHEGKMIARGARSITAEGLSNSGAQLVPAGTVLFSSRAPIGYVAIAASEVATNQGFKSFVLGPELVPDYVFYYLQAARHLALALASGTTFLEISGKNAALIPVPVPPVAEQHRIVAEVEKQFTRLDAAVAALKRISVWVKRYRTASLASAVSGAFLEASETDTSALTSTDHAGQHASSAWMQKRVDEVAALGSGNTPPNIVDHVSAEGDIPWFKVADMNHPENRVIMRRSDRWLSADAVRTLRLRVFPPGTILFPKRGGAIATNKKRLLQRFATCDLNIMGLTPLPDIAHYFFWWFESVDLARLSDGSNVPQINNKDIIPLIIAIPPQAERERIVAEIERRFSVADGLAAIVEANIQRAKTLRQSILHRAFSGQL